MTLEHVYWICGLFLMVFAVFSALDKANRKRFGNAAFWLLFAFTFAFGSYLSYAVTGLLVVIMTIVGGFGFIGSGNYHERSKQQKIELSHKYGNRIFMPALIVPIVTILLNKAVAMDALVAFGISAIVALLAALVMCRDTPVDAGQEGRRLIDAIGWAAILSQLLAALGSLFDKAKVGTLIAGLVSSVVPTENTFFCVVAYCFGMMLFTAVMGNAFAAFAVITAGIGVPLVIAHHGGNPAIVGVLGMLSGFCGTLLTPMAANFNIVPAALLELKDKNAVIKAQAPIAALMILVNIGLMYIMAF